MIEESTGEKSDTQIQRIRKQNKPTKVDAEAVAGSQRRKKIDIDEI